MIDDPKTLTVKTSEGYARIILDALSEVESSTQKHGDQRHRPLGFSRKNGCRAVRRHGVVKLIHPGVQRCLNKRSKPSR